MLMRLAALMCAAALITACQRTTSGHRYADHCEVQGYASDSAAFDRCVQEQRFHRMGTGDK
jgi:hypothetical protein